MAAGRRGLSEVMSQAEHGGPFARPEHRLSDEARSAIADAQGDRISLDQSKQRWEESLSKFKAAYPRGVDRQGLILGQTIEQNRLQLVYSCRAAIEKHTPNKRMEGVGQEIEKIKAIKAALEAYK